MAWSLGIIALLAWQASGMAERLGHVTGIGGIFVKSKDPRR